MEADKTVLAPASAYRSLFHRCSKDDKKMLLQEWRIPRTMAVLWADHVVPVPPRISRIELIKMATGQVTIAKLMSANLAIVASRMPRSVELAS